MTKKIIPCLDVKDGRVVKGTKFVNLRDAGDPVLCALEYCRQGADEVVLLDITATNEGRKTFLDVIEKTAKGMTVPLTVGGGIASLADMEAVLNAGASKVSINSAAVKNKALVAQAAQKFGKEKLVVAVDVGKAEDGSYHVLIAGGTVDTGLDAVAWMKECEALGAGAVLLTSMDADGVQTGYDNAITKQAVDALTIPVIASGGCGSVQHIVDMFKQTNASAALAATLFHFQIASVQEVRDALKANNIN